MSKDRNGAKIYRKHDHAATPYQRLLTANLLNTRTAQELKEYFLNLNPLELYHEIQAAKQALFNAAPLRFINDATINP